MICGPRSRPSSRTRCRLVRTYTIRCSSMSRPLYGTTYIPASSVPKCIYSTFSKCRRCRNVSAVAPVAVAAVAAALPVPALCCRRQVPASSRSNNNSCSSSNYYCCLRHQVVLPFRRESSLICQWIAAEVEVVQCCLQALAAPAAASMVPQRRPVRVVRLVLQTHCHAAQRCPLYMRIRSFRFAMTSKRCRWRAVVAAVVQAAVGVSTTIIPCDSRAIYWLRHRKEDWKLDHPGM